MFKNGLLTPSARKGKFLAENKPNNIITKCTGSSLNHPARRLVNIRETIPERPRWKETTRDMRD